MATLSFCSLPTNLDWSQAKLLDQRWPVSIYLEDMCRLSEVYLMMLIDIIFIEFYDLLQSFFIHYCYNSSQLPDIKYELKARLWSNSSLINISPLMPSEPTSYVVYFIDDLIDGLCHKVMLIFQSQRYPLGNHGLEWRIQKSYLCYLGRWQRYL